MLLIQSFFFNFIRKWIELWYCIFKFTVLSNEDFLQVLQHVSPLHGWGDTNALVMGGVTSTAGSDALVTSTLAGVVSPLSLRKRLPAGVGEVFCRLSPTHAAVPAKNLH